MKVLRNPFFAIPLIALLSIVASAAVADELDGLNIADELSAGGTGIPINHDKRVFLELAGGRSLKSTSSPSTFINASFDYWLQHRVNSDWRAIVSGRLDISDGSASSRSEIHTLRELALQWQPTSNSVFDVGRINMQFGEGIGFNPTDVFREGALRNVTSIIPADLRRNRQGTVMLSAQRLWEGGALLGVIAPRIPGNASSDTFSPDLSSTNSRDRVVLSLSQRVGAELTPQLLLVAGRKQSPEIGFNLSALPLAGLVAYGEINVARRPSTLAAIDAWPSDIAWRPQSAVGFTWSLSDSASLTVEHDTDHTGNDNDRDAALMRMPVAMQQVFQQELIRRQRLPDRQPRSIGPRSIVDWAQKAAPMR